MEQLGMAKLILKLNHVCMQSALPGLDPLVYCRILKQGFLYRLTEDNWPPINHHGNFSLGLSPGVGDT